LNVSESRQLAAYEYDGFFAAMASLQRCPEYHLDVYGNDFQTWANPDDDAVVLAVAKGVKSVDPNHIHTTELNYLTSGSLDDARWDPIVDLNGAYTYYPTYAQVLKEYNRPNFRPVFMEEANYEFEHHADAGSLPNLRRQEYWTMLPAPPGSCMVAPIPGGSPPACYPTGG
jgi:hypothetical protein